jgi:membrane associated rhomboid family serine protease
MIESRDYPGQPHHPPRGWWSGTNTLLAINVSVFLGQEFVRGFLPRVPLEHYLALSLDGLRHGFVWQLLTFQFLHGGILHLLLNSWGIFVFGPAVENALGRSRFLRLYLTSGAVGGGLHVLGSLLFPGHFGVITQYGSAIYVPVVGASAGLFGLMAAFATMYPHQDLKVLLFFVFPVTVSARVLLGVCAGISLVGVLFTRSNVAHGAHLGGMLAGFVYIRLMGLAHRD